MPEQKPILQALETSIIVNRRDQIGQIAWTQWRTGLVLTGGTPSQAGDLALLGPNGQFDPSVIPNGGGGGTSVYVNGTLVNNPNFQATLPAAPSGFANVVWQFTGSSVSAYYATPQQPQTFTPIAHEFLTGYSATTGLFSAAQPSASDLTNGTTGTGAVVLAGSPTFTGTAQVANIYITGELLDSTDSPGTSGYILSSTATGTLWIPNTSGSVAFSGITSGTNTTASMVVGTGASITVTGTGVVQSTQIQNVVVSATPPTLGQVLTATSPTAADWQTPTSSSTAFSAITSGTNTTATMNVGTGASLQFTGSGVVNANELYNVAVTSTPPVSGQVLTATSATTAIWQSPSTSTGNFLQATVDFGSDTGPITRVFDTTLSVAATWVTVNSIILIRPAGQATSTHYPDDALFEEIEAVAESLVPGVGFTLHAYSPFGSWGQYVFNCTGA